MKTHTKTTLQKLVFELMPPGNPVPSDEEIEKWKGRLPRIRKDVIQVVRLTMFGNLSHKFICRHLGQIRLECTLMMDALYHYPEFPERLMPLYQTVLDCLEHILTYLQTHYVDYLDQKAKMPVMIYLREAKEIEAQIDAMVAVMAARQINKTLQALIVGKMTVLVSSGKGSYNQIASLKKIQDWILELSSGQPKTDITADLMTMLIRANFNTAGFVAYYKQQLATELMALSDPREQYFHLYHHEKQLKKLVWKYNKLGLDPDQADLKQCLLVYLATKIAGYRLENQIGSAVIPHHANTPAVPDALVKEENYRIEVAFSVDALAYLFKLLINAGVVIAEPKSQLFQFIAKNFKTPGTVSGNMSGHSFGNKYNQTVQATAKVVRAALARMLKLLDKEFDLA